MTTSIDLPRRRANHILKIFTTNLRGIIANLFPPIWLWLATLVFVVFDIYAFHVSHKYFIYTHDLWPIVLYPLICIPISWWLSRGDNANKFISRPLRLFMMPAYLSPAMCALVGFGYIVMANSNPMVDPMLAHWDQVLGLNWYAYTNFIGEHAWLAWTLSQAYNLMIKGILIVIAIAIVEGQTNKATELIALTLFTCLITTVIGAWFPAQSAMTYLADDKLRSLFPPGTGNFFVHELLEVRDNIPKYIDFAHVEGIVQFPSFHTICGILLIYGARGAKWRFIPALIIGLLMIAATPVYGGHYFADMIAGAAIAFSAIAVSQLVFMRKATTEKIAL